jgi:hypothetical protein
MEEVLNILFAQNASKLSRARANFEFLKVLCSMTLVGLVSLHNPCLKLNKTGNVCIKVTLKPVCLTIVAM